MKSGSFTSNTSFTASAASIVIPSGYLDIDSDAVRQIIIPEGVKVIKVKVIKLTGGQRTAYVGVTPGTAHVLRHDTEDVNHGARILHNVWCGTHSGTGVLLSWLTNDADSDEPVTIAWSPEINNHTPDVTHY